MTREEILSHVYNIHLWLDCIIFFFKFFIL